MKKAKENKNPDEETVQMLEAQPDDVRTDFSETARRGTNTPLKKEQHATRTTKRHRGKVGKTYNAATCLPITSACQYRSSTATFSTTMETWINCFSRARIRMEKLAYYLLQPLRPENWKTQGATYLVLRKNEGLNAEKLTNYQLSYPGVLLTPQ